MYRLLALVLFCMVLVAQPAAAKTWYVDPGGSGDALTIGAGLASAVAGDTVSVASGEYFEHGLVMKSGVVLHSQTYNPYVCTIDAEGLGRAILCDGVADTTVVFGFTIRGGHAAGTGDDGSGGAVACLNSSSPVISTCNFYDNTADEYGGAIYCSGGSSAYIGFSLFSGNTAGGGGGGLACLGASQPYLFLCTFFANATPGDGGGIYCTGGSSLDMNNCTFLRNSAAGHGGGIYSDGGSQPGLGACLVAFSLDGEGVYAGDAGSAAWLGCTDIYGNADGDWIGHIADQLGTLGNFGADPLFCDTLSQDVWLEECSPCRPGYHPDGYTCGTTIGSKMGYGCGCGEPTVPTTWGTLKALYH
jgi:predicted outer membrane repeat protein